MYPVVFTSSKMKVALILYVAIALATSDKLDRTYLPPPGSKLAGGSPGAIQVPLEYPKLTYSTTAKPLVSYDISSYPNIVEGNYGTHRSPIQILPTGSSTPSTNLHYKQFPYSLPTETDSTSQRSSLPAIAILNDVNQQYGLSKVVQDEQEKNDNYPRLDDQSIQYDEIQAIPDKFSSSQLPASSTQDFEGNLGNSKPKFIEGQFVEEVNQYNHGRPGSLESVLREPSLGGNISILPAPIIDNINKMSRITSYPDHKASQNYPNPQIFTNNVIGSRNQDNSAGSQYPSTSEAYESTSAEPTFSTTTLYPKYSDYVENSYPISKQNFKEPIISRNNLLSKDVNYPTRSQANSDRKAVILNYDNVITPDGNFAYNFDTSNGIHADESGNAANGVKAVGSYSYTGDDGNVYTVTYTADENGFKPQGNHLPTAPPIPEAILKVIEQSMKDKEAGIYDDGSYDDNKYGHKNYQSLKERADSRKMENLKIGVNGPMNSNIFVSVKNKPFQFEKENNGRENDEDYELIESDVNEGKINDKIDDKTFIDQPLSRPSEPTSNLINTLNQDTSRRRPYPNQLNNFSNSENILYEDEKEDTNAFPGDKNSNSQLNRFLNKDDLLDSRYQKPLKKPISILKPNSPLGMYDRKHSGTLVPQNKIMDVTTIEYDGLKNILPSAQSGKPENPPNISNLFGENFTQSTKKYSSPISIVKISNNHYIPPIHQEQRDDLTHTEFTTKNPIQNVPLQDRQDNDEETGSAFKIPDEFTNNNQKINDLTQLNNNNHQGYSTLRPSFIGHNEPKRHKVIMESRTIPMKTISSDNRFPSTTFSSRRPVYQSSTIISPSPTQRYIVDQKFNQPLLVETGSRPGQRIVTPKRPGYTISSTTPFPPSFKTSTRPVYSHTHTYPNDSTFSTTYSPPTTSKSTITYPDETAVTEYDYSARPGLVTSIPGSVSTISSNGLPTTIYSPNLKYGDKIIEGIADEYGNPIIVNTSPSTQTTNEDSSLFGYTYPSPSEFRTVSEGNPSTKVVKGQSATTGPNTEYGNQPTSTNNYREDFSGPKQHQTYDDETGYHYKKK